MKDSAPPKNTVAKSAEPPKEPEPGSLKAHTPASPKESKPASPQKKSTHFSYRGNSLKNFFKLRDEPSLLCKLFMGLLCVGIIFFVWWFATRGPAEKRLISPAALGSPAEVFGSFHSLWFDRALTRNTIASLKRVLEGYGLALLIGIPLGILGGCFRRIGAFLAPITIFGRNIPVAALLPLTMLWFGIDELQKVMFIFVACVAFVISDATEIITNIDEKYLDTAKTLGASRSQMIFKVLVPLALPDLFNSMRLLFGLGFGYIILAEVVNMDSGLGTLISNSQRRGPREHVYLCLIVITLVAYGIDRLLFFAGKKLFPYRYSE